MEFSILFIGDIVGTPGMNIVETFLPSLEKKYNPDVIIANGENACDGKGCTEKEGKKLLELNVKVITGGNHTWDRRQSQDYLKEEPRSLRPLNYPKGTYGNGLFIEETPKGKLAVISLQGRAFMNPIDCPFRTVENAIKHLPKDVKYIFVDFHAEATAEKIAMSHFLDGKITALVGTHTHIQTSDERILENGTAYITDVGMTGPYDSVIGMKTVAALNRFLYQTPQKYQAATDNVHLSGVFIKADTETGKAVSIERIFFPEFEK